jgi:hypothetical protein
MLAQMCIVFTIHWSLAVGKRPAEIVMSLVGIYLLAAFALQGYQVSVEGGLWAAATLCAVLAARHHGSRGPFVTICAAGIAVLLGSLALVAP